MNKRIVHLIAFIALCGAPCFAQQNPDPVARASGGFRGRLLVGADAEYIKSGEGSTIKLKDGALLHLVSRHQRDPKEPNSDLWPSVIAACVSRDGGVTWSRPEVLFRSTTGKNAMSASLARLPNGALGVSYSQIDAEDRANKVFRVSRDEGGAWSEPRFISPTDGYWTSAHDRITVLSTGRIIHPLHVKVSVKPRKIVTRIAYSDDNGESWRIAPQTLAIEEVLPAFKQKFPDAYISVFAEATIVERADKSLLLYGRTLAGRQYQCVSTDGGETWTQPAPSTLISGAAPARLHRIPNSNDLLVVWNSCCLDPQANILLGERLTLSAAISSDGGQTWRGQRELESVAPGNRVEYPTVNIYDGVVYLTYRARSVVKHPAAGVDTPLSVTQEYLSVLPLAWFYAERDQHHPAAAQTVSGNASAPGVDPIAQHHGGLRGTAVSQYSERYPYPDAGSTLKLKDGSLLHIVNRRERLPELKNSHAHYDPTVIAKVVSRDGGKTWSEMEELFRSNTGHTASNASLVRLANGEIGASYNRIDSVDLTKPSSGFWTESVKRANRVFRYSKDEGRMWSPEIAMTPLDGYWTGAHDRFLVLASGRVLHPLHHIYSYEPYKIGVRVAYSDDHGRSWKLNSEMLVVEEKIPNYSRPHRQAVFAEANVVERADGSLLLMARTITGRQYYSTSSDKGVTWSKPYPSPVLSPEAPARLVRVPNSNDLLLIWTSCCFDAKHNLLGERLTLSSAISTDGGETWKWQREFVSVAPGLTHGADYQSIYFDGDKVLVAYTSCAKTEGKERCQHYLAALPLAWFYAERDNQQPETIRTMKKQ